VPTIVEVEAIIFYPSCQELHWLRELKALKPYVAGFKDRPRLPNFTRGASIQRAGTESMISYTLYSLINQYF